MRSVCVPEQGQFSFFAGAGDAQMLVCAAAILAESGSLAGAPVRDALPLQLLPAGAAGARDPLLRGHL